MFFSLKNKPCSQTRQGKDKAQIPGIGVIAGLRSSGCSEDCSVRQGNCLILDGHHSTASCTKYLRGIRDSTGRCAGICRGTGIIRGAGIIWCIIRSIGFIRGVRCCGWCCGWCRLLGYYRYRRRRRRFLGYYRCRRRLFGYHRYRRCRRRFRLIRFARTVNLSTLLILIRYDASDNSSTIIDSCIRSQNISENRIYINFCCIAKVPNNSVCPQLMFQCLLFAPCAFIQPVIFTVPESLTFTTTVFP